MDIKSGGQSPKSDLLAVALSFLAGIIQLLLFVVGTLGQTAGLQKLFIRPEIVPFSILISLIIALCLVGIISFFTKNSDIFKDKQTFKPFIFLKNIFFVEDTSYWAPKKTAKKRLALAGLALLFLSFIFIVTTLYNLTAREYLFINRQNADIYQLLSFMGLWILTPVILYVWISNEIQNNYLFKPENFIPNLIRSLQNQGFIFININEDIALNDGTHLVSIILNKKKRFFIVQFDGKRINRELEREDYLRVLNPQAQNNQTIQ